MQKLGHNSKTCKVKGKENQDNSEERLINLILYHYNILHHVNVSRTRDARRIRSIVGESWENRGENLQN
jgi:hypothetical protein